MQFGKGLFLTLFISWLFLTTGANAQLTAKVQAKTYKGPEGRTLTIVALESSEGPATALVQLNGEPALGDKAIFFTEIRPSMREEVYYARYANPVFNIARRILSEGDPDLLVPNMSGMGEFRFYFPASTAEAKAIAIPAQEVIAAYLAQLTPPIPSSAGREQLLKGYQETVTRIAAQLQKACDAPLTVTVNWESFPDNTLRTFDAGEMCKRALDGVKNICRSKLGANSVKEKISSIECSLEKNPSVLLKDKKLSLGVATSAGEAESRTRSYLEDKL